MNSIPAVTRWVALASVVGLIGLILVWNLAISPPQSAPVVVLLGAYLLRRRAVKTG